MDLSKLAGQGFDLLLQAAPTVAGMLGTAVGGPLGPLAGVAVSALEQQFGLTPPEDTPLASRAQVALAAAATATPDQLVALHQADLAHAEKLAAAGIDLETLAVKDRDSARQREMSVKDWAPRALAIVVLVAWVAAYAAVMFASSVPPQVTDGLRTLDAALMLVLAYYFGSSAGSAAKTALLAQAEPIK